MSFPDGWTIPTKGKYRGDDLDSLRYHALGNAVTPPVAEWLANRIRIHLSTRQTSLV
jgi:DNA (cytosine-5)-methyltransferase 1